MYCRVQDMNFVYCLAPNHFHLAIIIFHKTNQRKKMAFRSNRSIGGLFRYTKFSV